MLLSLFFVLYIIKVLAGVMFEQLSWNCGNSSFYSSLRVESLILCGAICVTDKDCQTFEFADDTMVCNLYSMRKPCCNGSTAQGSLSYRRTVVQICEFDVEEDARMSLTKQCGPTFLQPLFIARMKGPAIINTVLSDSEIPMDGIVCFIRLAFSHLQYVFYSRWSGLYEVKNVTVHDPSTWFYYWISFTNHENGTTEVHVGQDMMPGCNTLLSRSYQENFTVFTVEARNQKYGNARITFFHQK